MIWLILWRNNARIGSVELTPENLSQLQSQFWMYRIQRDAAGHEHWEVTGTK